MSADKREVVQKIADQSHIFATLPEGTQSIIILMMRRAYEIGAREAAS